MQPELHLLTWYSMPLSAHADRAELGSGDWTAGCVSVAAEPIPEQAHCFGHPSWWPAHPALLLLACLQASKQCQQA